MTRKVLCVDDELNVLLGFQRHYRKQFDLEVALGPEKALQVIAEKGPYAVVVSDLKMPGMDGTQFLSRVRQMSPDTVRIMLTGHADVDAAAAAVNEGNVFQFLTKPCPPEMFARAIEAALHQHRLITSEKELLERTLKGSIAVMTEVLSLVNPLAFSRAQRIRHYVEHMARELKLRDRWRYELAAMLSQIGCVAVPQYVMEKYHTGAELTAEEQEVFLSQCSVGHDLLAQIPRLEEVARMVALQRQPWSTAHKSDIADIGGNLLRIAIDFDDRVLHGDAVETVFGMMLVRTSDYNPEFVAVLRLAQVEQVPVDVRSVRVADLRPGMVMDEDVCSINGVLLVAKGQEVTEPTLACLRSFMRTAGVVEPLRVAVRSAALNGAGPARTAA